MTPAPSAETSVAELAGGLRTVVNRLAFQLRTPATRSGLTPTRLSAIAILEKLGPQRPGDLAARLGISAASMSRLTEALEAGSWIARSFDPEDRRARLLAISGHGLDALADLRREGTSQLADDLAAISPEDRAALAAALPVLVALAERHLES